MKKHIVGVAGAVVLLAATAAYASDTIQSVRQVLVQGEPLKTDLQVTEDGTTMVSARALAEALGAKVEWNETDNKVDITNSYREFVAALLNGKYNLTYEVIASKPDTTIIYSKGYQEVPSNTDFQKLFLLLLVEQLDPQIQTKQIEFWSDKEHALSFAAGTFVEDGLEGWTGMNSRFAVLAKKGERVSLSHILSVHERDWITIGKYNQP
ncbi:copper amine oxidase N-terminal domain-containing protein [Paenibacillus sp. GD4]|uniref:copper amine oxidase N-terminal domain-containing protein n=1 Tax=Paenibacillus sp. GD4 TaxID=3068890 RepID=UPI002796AF27|nr:copper amine oxidase N-terminal domain-containing protein [Paenibacillus sp. GD4]MDQ1914730.1 copper amine oxidase N-terminal domain-containing protein [Paenibacillus sp. GD4]